jgi:hypothetical protein
VAEGATTVDARMDTLARKVLQVILVLSIFGIGILAGYGLWGEPALAHAS